ncbi:MAG: YfhO family protein [Lachnospiraceae bacterium]
MKKEYRFRYWHAFLLPLIAMLLGCITKGIFPFGVNSFLRSDLYNQYIQFIQEFCQSIRDGESLAYSFEIGLGSGFSALYAYYVASPSNLLLVLVPEGMMIEALTTIVFVKVGLCGLTFSYYLAKHYKEKGLSTLLFACGYALSGFMAAYQWNVMWLDVVILAPLVLLALERLVNEEKGSTYCILLACSIFTNFYLSIMLCIFLTIYFIGLVVWKPYKLKKILLFVGYSTLAGCMTAALLIPVYVSLSGTEFHAWAFPDEIEWYMNALELFMRHCMDVNMKVQYDHWPNIYTGVSFFLLLPLYIMNKKISIKSKITKLTILVFMWLSFSCNVLDIIWHGMNFPDSLPARQGYLYTWLALIIGYELYQHFDAVKWYEITIATLLSIALVIAGILFVDIEGVDYTSYALTLVFLILYVVLMFVYKFIQQIHDAPEERLEAMRILQIILLMIVVVELFTNLILTSLRTANRETFLTHYESMEEAILWLEEYDTDFYRIELFDRLTKNDSMMWDINTATLFSSTANADVSNMYYEMGMGHTKVSYWYQGATPLTSALLSVQYMLGENDTYENSLYDIVYEEGEAYIYRNVYTLPIGYGISSDTVDRWDYTNNSPLMAQSDLCYELGIKGMLYQEIEDVYIDEQEYHLNVTNSGYIYVYIGNNSISEVIITIDDQVKRFKQVSFDYVLDLGYIEAGSEVSVEIIEDSDDEFRHFVAYRMNEEVLVETIELLNESPLEVFEHTQDSLTGHIVLDEAQDVVISVPMEQGWHVYVNGQEVEPDTFMDVFIRLRLDEGEYDIYMEYETPGMFMGLGISILACFIWILIRRKEKV